MQQYAFVLQSCRFSLLTGKLRKKHLNKCTFSKEIITIWIISCGISMSGEMSGPPCPYSFRAIRGQQNKGAAKYFNSSCWCNNSSLLDLGLFPDIQGFIYFPKYASPHQCTSDWFCYSCISQVTCWMEKKLKWATPNYKQVRKWIKGEWMKSSLAQGSIGTVLQVDDFFFLRWWSVSLWGQENEMRIQGSKSFL